MNEISLAFVVFISGFVSGALLISYYDNNGRSRKEVQRYHRMVLRMIPKLREHYSADYVYWELIHGDETPNPKAQKTDLISK
jgi:hypothetical protein